MKMTKILAMLLSLASATGFYSCSNDDDVKPALQSPSVTETAGNYNSLSFQWDDVPDAVQYGYRLSDSNDLVIDAGVTHKKSVTFYGLQPASKYTLEVWAFASMDGDYSTPPAVTLTASTDPLVKLSTPDNLAISQEDGCIATWSEVENAREYVFTVVDAGNAVVNEGTTEATSVVLSGLPEGDYSFSVFANGYDGFESGDTATASFHVESSILYTVTGTYHSAQLNANWDASMVAYSNGTYSILAFYGVEGYNLDFSVDPSNEEDMFRFINGEYVDDTDAGYTTWQIPTGLSEPAMLITYPWYNYSSMNGDESSGTVSIGCYYGDNYAEWGNDTFTWPSENASGMTTDDLVGTYNNHCWGENSINDTWTWEEFNATDWTATITKVDSNTISVDGIYWIDTPIVGTVDFVEMAITFQPQAYADYIFADKNSATNPVMGFINGDGSISIPDFGLWYDFGSDGCYVYMTGSSELTKAAALERPAQKKKAVKVFSQQTASAAKPTVRNMNRR